MPHTPETIGPYEVIRPIAQGGMAEVFEVRDPDSGERRALKLLMELKTSVKRFNREFEALTRLNHPNILRVYRYGFHEDHPWMSMELLRGVPLQTRVKSFGPPGTPDRVQEVLRIGYHIAHALQYIHDRGLVHRDLKSANVQVLRDGRVKLLDFGTAHLVDPLEQLTQEGDFVGTFSYAAPEQIVGTHIDHRADLYAFGVLMYRLLTGRRPFKAPDPHQVAHMHLHTAPKKVRELVPDLDVELEELVDWCLRKKRRDRPQRAEELARRLEELAGSSLAMAGPGIALYDDRAIGRAVEVRKVWHVMEQEELGHVVVVCAGDPDERTRFLDQAAADGQQRELPTVQIHLGDDPLSSIAHGLVSLVHGEDDEATTLQRLLGAREGMAAGRRVGALSEGISILVQRLAQQQLPALVTVDEIHQLDAPAVNALAELITATRTAGAGLQLVVSADRPQSDAVLALERAASGATHVDLSPLDARGTALAVGALLHRRPPPTGVARRIHALTGGHPSLIERLIREHVHAGRLAVHDGDANRIDWLDDVELSATALDEAMDRTLGALPPSWRRVLEVVDVTGGHATGRMVAEATGLRLDELRSVVDAMREEDLIAWDGHAGDIVTPRQPMLARHVGARTRPHQRAVIRHLVADLVEQEEPTAAQVRLLVAVGRSGPALELGVECAQDMLETGDAAGALDLLEVLHGYADHPGLPAELRVRYQLLLAAAMQRVRPMDARGVRALDAAERLAAGPLMQARVRLGRAEQQRAIGHYTNHRRNLFDAWALVEHEPPSPLRASLALELARSHVYGAQLAQAATWFDTALEAATAAGERDLVDRARVGIAELHLSQGRVPEAEAATTALLDERGLEGDPEIRWSARAAWGHAVRRQGRFSDAIPPLLEALDEARAAGAVPAWAALCIAAASCELDLYRLGRAQELIEELLAAIGPGERLHIRLETRLFQGRLHLASGMPLSANFLLEEVTDQAEKAGLAQLAHSARAALAEARWVAGAHDEARQLFQTSLLGLMSTGDQTALADAIVSRARATGASDDPTKAFKLVRRMTATGVCVPLEVEQLLAEARWFEAHGDRFAAEEATGEAREKVDALAESLDTIERAALRVHPWAHELHLGAVA